jgi:hypothetical protein
MNETHAIYRPKHALISCGISSERKRLSHSFSNARSVRRQNHPNQKGNPFCLPSEGPAFLFISFVPRVIPSATELDIAAILTHSLRQQDTSGIASQQPRLRNTSSSSGSPFNPIADADNGSECCGGLIDCGGLVE